MGYNAVMVWPIRVGLLLGFGIGVPKPAPAGAPIAALLGDLAPKRALIQKAHRAGQARPPKTPHGLAACEEAIPLHRLEPWRLGETIRYVVDIDGLSVGTFDFRVARRGVFGGERVTEFRSLFKVDALVSNFVAIEGRAAALVPERGWVPSLAMSRFRAAAKLYREDLHYELDGRGVASQRSHNGRARSVVRAFPTATYDFISAFYALRSMPIDVRGCTVIYGNQRAYTVWIEPTGEELVKTPVGLRAAHRYQIRYASERARSLLEGTVWIGQQGARLPYRAIIHARNTLEARVHLYDPGR